MNPKKTYHVSPDGSRLVEASRFAKLKPGWRIATQDDWDEAVRKQAEAERKKAEAVPPVEAPTDGGKPGKPKPKTDA